MLPVSVYMRAAKNFMCGQVVSLFSLLALVMAKRLVYRDVNTPVLLNACFYIFLSVTAVLCNYFAPSVSSLPSPPASTRKAIPWWVYPLLAIVDLQANVCSATALQYTTFATAALALNLAVPFVFLLSVCAFRASYKWQHSLGCLVTLAGGGVLLVACYNRETALASNDTYGWSLAVLAAMLYAGSTVLNQWCTQQQGLDGVLACLARVGAWGSLFCMAESLLVEREQIAAVVWDTQIFLLVFGYVLCMFAFYAAVFVLVEATESMLYNVSLLSSSVYLMLLSCYALDETPDLMTCAASLTMLLGLAMYTLTREPVGGEGTSTGGLPQISFKSMHTPRELVPNKLQMAQV
jgi:drug/metabolite transporter (DMT)-like permease